MRLNRVPEGWTPERLAALNELDDLAAALGMVNTIMTATGDASDEAKAVRADLVAEARKVWARVKGLDTP